MKIIIFTFLFVFLFSLALCNFGVRTSYMALETINYLRLNRILLNNPENKTEIDDEYTLLMNYGTGKIHMTGIYKDKTICDRVKDIAEKNPCFMIFICDKYFDLVNIKRLARYDHVRLLSGNSISLWFSGAYYKMALNGVEDNAFCQFRYKFKKCVSHLIISTWETDETNNM
jgi:hypothetical protein